MSNKTKEPLSWNAKCQVVQSFLDVQDVKIVRHNTEIGWFGRVKEWFFGSKLSREQLKEFQDFMEKLNMFDMTNVLDSKFEEEEVKKIGFGFSPDQQ